MVHRRARLALVSGLGERLGRIGFYVLFALAVTVSVQLVGVYLVFASLIVPALATRGMTRARSLLAAYRWARRLRDRPGALVGARPAVGRAHRLVLAATAVVFASLKGRWVVPLHARVMPRRLERTADRAVRPRAPRDARRDPALPEEAFRARCAPFPASQDKTMTDPRNVAHDKKVQQEKKHHGEEAVPGAEHAPQPGKKPHLVHPDVPEPDVEAS